MLAYLAEKRHPVAEQALRQFVTALEESLLAEPPDGGSGDRNQWLGHLDETCAALARHATPGSWRTLVDHGLRTEPQLGHPAARLAELGGHNLGVQPELVSRLVAAAVADIRRRLLARPTAAQAERLGHVVAALADTRTTEVQELLETLAGRFPDEDVGWRAARVLANAGTGGGFDASVGPTLSGDLRVLGLPTLLQSLADSRVSGVLRLVDLRGRSVATMEFERGLLATARYGSLEGGPLAAASKRDARALKDLTPLLLEGLRRHDQLRHASVIVPDDARLAPTGRPPRAVTGEDDIDLVISLWEKVVAGTTPQECERPTPTASAAASWTGWRTGHCSSVRAGRRRTGRRGQGERKRIDGSEKRIDGSGRIQERSHRNCHRVPPVDGDGRERPVNGRSVRG